VSQAFKKTDTQDAKQTTEVQSKQGREPKKRKGAMEIEAEGFGELRTGEKEKRRGRACKTWGVGGKGARGASGGRIWDEGRGVIGGGCRPKKGGYKHPANTPPPKTNIPEHHTNKTKGEGDRVGYG